MTAVVGIRRQGAAGFTPLEEVGWLGPVQKGCASMKPKAASMKPKSRGVAK